MEKWREKNIFVEKGRDKKGGGSQVPFQNQKTSIARSMH